MKRAFIVLALLVVVGIAVPLLASCLECYSVQVPYPEGGSSSELVCLDLAVPTGWINCEVDDGARMCFTQGLCWNDYDDPFPRV